MDYQEQVDRWVRGELDRKGEEAHSNGQCCPDFACCNPGNAATQEERERFRDCEADRSSLLMLFLGRAITRHMEEKGKDPSKVYVTGGEDEISRGAPESP